MSVIEKNVEDWYQTLTDEQKEIAARTLEFVKDGKSRTGAATVETAAATAATEATIVKKEEEEKKSPPPQIINDERTQSGFDSDIDDPFVIMDAPTAEHADAPPSNPAVVSADAAVADAVASDAEISEKPAVAAVVAEINEAPQQSKPKKRKAAESNGNDDGMSIAAQTKAANREMRDALEVGKLSVDFNLSFGVSAGQYLLDKWVHQEEQQRLKKQKKQTKNDSAAASVAE